MTTMSEPGTHGYLPAPRALRRSSNDRIISGVAGGLGQYFGVDAVIFRVLFAVLSFFGGVGLLAYALAWLLIPEPEIGVSVLDRALHQLRLRRVPPWLVVFGGALLLWLCWFSWWAPGPSFPAVLLLAVLAMVLLHRLGNRPDAARPAMPPPAAPATGAAAGAAAGAEPHPAGIDPLAGTDTGGGTDPRAAETPDSEPVEQPTEQLGGFEWQPPQAAGVPTAPLIPPLNDTRRSMQAWLAEAGEAHRVRVRRRRPIKVGVGLALVAGWGFVAMLDAFTRVPFPAYLWVGLGILGAGLLLSLVTRRLTLSLLVPIAMLTVLAIGLGGTRASLRDGSGQIGWLPTSASQLTDHHQFAGQSTLDLTALGKLPEAKTVKIVQAAGMVRIRIPAGMNTTVISDVHIGDIRNGTSDQTGQHVSGLNVHLELDPPAGVSGAPLTIYVSLTTGHVQVDRAG